MGRAVVDWSLDTFVSSNSPSTAHTSSQYIWVTHNDRVGYIQMNTPAPLGATIISAKLRLRSTTTQASAFIEVGRCRARPAYGSMSWNNRASRVTDSHVEVAQNEGATDWEFDVTDHMQAVSNGSNWYGWTVHAANPSGNVRFYSQESGRGPQLEVEWSDRPDAPTALSPSGARNVSITHPTLTFDVVDVAGDTTLSAVQVQINRNSSSMASPDFDSGEVFTSTPQLDLSETAWTGAVQGEWLYWRARAMDGAGLWSEWSNVTSFGYEGKGTLEVITPSVTKLTISDNTPLVAWEMSGRTQAAYQIIVTWVEKPTEWLWTSGKITSDVTSITLPEGVLTKDDRTYRITVRTWDTLKRVHTPGDPARYQVQRDVTFDDDQSVLPVETLSVDMAGGVPEAVLSATRATTPDRWMILRDNNIIHSAAGLDLWVEGDRYEYTDRTAPGMTDMHYRFQPVENHVRSWGNPVAAARMEPQFLWLLSLDGELRVPIAGLDERPALEWEREPQQEMLTPLGARTPIIVRQSLGPRTGTVEGVIVDDLPGAAGASVADHKESLRLMEASMEPVRLVAGDENVPVVIHSVMPETRRKRDGKEATVVSFAFFQDGEYPEEA